MSRAALFLVFAGALPVTAPAQDALAWRDSASQLSARVQALRDSLLEGDSTVSEVLRANGLVVAASATRREAAAEAFQELQRVRMGWFGGALPSPDGFRIVVRSIGTEPGAAPFGFLKVRAGQVIVAGLPDTGATVRSERVVSRESLSRTVVDAYGEMMVGALPSAVAKWLERPPPLHLPDDERRYLVMYAVMTGAGNAERGCAVGHPADCAYVLALREPTTGEPGGRYPEYVRADLFLFALETGGQGAWTRMTDPVGGTAEQVLRAASGLPADTLLLRWRESVLALRPDTAPLSRRGGAMAIGWTAVLLLGTLGASRWA